MSFFIKCLILGIVQGITEPLPISSSGHVAIIGNIIGAQDLVNELNFSILLNFGSLLAILILFRKEIIDLIIGTYKYIIKKDKEYKSDFNYILMIIIGTIPVGIAGLFLKDHIDNLLKTFPKIIGIGLIITAIFLFIIKDYKGRKKSKQISVIDAITVGLFQIIALIPGISRSGATITGGLLRNLNRKAAFSFSFMLYIPVSLASMVLDIKDINFSDTKTIIPYIIATIASSILTYFSTKIFKSIIEKGKLIYFVVYCAIVGILITIFI